MKVLKIPVLGILAGLNPLVSSEFLCTIYEHHLGPARLAPEVVLLSAPSAPDLRLATESVGAQTEPAPLEQEQSPQEEEKLLRVYIDQQLSRLSYHCDRMVLPCYAAHHFLPPSPDPKFWSLLDLSRQMVQGAAPSRILCLTTPREQALGLFTRCGDHLIQLQQVDQEQCLLWLQSLQEGFADPTPAAATLLRWLEQYQAQHLLVGCADLHRLARRCPQLPWLDPLTAMAQKWNRLVSKLHQSQVSLKAN